MTIDKMISNIETIMDQALHERDVQNYSELMYAAYNLWALLYYDMNCEYPSHEPPKEGTFDF